MNYQEELLWIVDCPGTTNDNMDEKIRENIAFVHSLGLKCDSVGWSTLNLADPRANEILEHISAFCKKNGWTSRGIYKRYHLETNPQWFEIVPNYFKGSTVVDEIETTTTDSQQVSTCVIRAFQEIDSHPKIFRNDFLVSEKFHNSCIQHNFQGVNFCWAKDVGKYEAGQYFHLYAAHQIPKIAVDFDLKKSPQRIQAAGGWLPRLTEVIHTLQFINLPDCYLSEDLPSYGFAYAYIPRTFSCAGRNRFLIHKDIAQTLLKEKALSARALKPVTVVDQLPGGYILAPTEPLKQPSTDFTDKMLAEYEILKAKHRPTREVSEKAALKLMRDAKRERKEDFQKPMSIRLRQELLSTDYAPVIPYYLIANGCLLSDEYEFLSYNQAAEENDAFHKNLENEELLEEKPEGIVIAKTISGDTVLLCKDGAVTQFSHEAPEVTDRWPSLAQFIVIAIQD